MAVKLFTPIDLGGITLPNRIVVSPMCQYSADDGSMTDWHTVHLGTFACSGAGLFVVEKTNVTREGRITHGCTGLYTDHNEQAMARAVQVYRAITRNPIGVQIGHAGRKASTHPPFKGGKALAEHESPWRTVAPSPIPFAEGWHRPHELDKKEIQDLIDAFVASAERAKRIGFDVVELHSAHGYLLHQFLSPLSNQRKDEYGKNRMKFPLEVAAAVRETWPKERALGARINATDWVDGGWTPEETVVLAKELKKRGMDYMDVSTGGLSPLQKIPLASGYQVPFAEKVKKESGITTMTVGLIAGYQQAEDIVASGKADLVCLARAAIWDPRWAWHAAEELGAETPYAPKTMAGHPKLRPQLFPKRAQAAG